MAAGTTIYSMPCNTKNDKYEKYAKEYDIHFIFSDIIPHINFYTIPQVDIMATDSLGGFIGTIGRQSDLESDAPICYIDKDKTCYLIASNGAEFLAKVSEWRNNLMPYNDIVFYSNKLAAENELEFIDINEIASNLA